MTERAITFSGEIVRAILEGHKTQTRRPLQHVPVGRVDKYINDEIEKIFWHPACRSLLGGNDLLVGLRVKCPFGKVGDHLWVKEKYVLSSANQPIYEADCRDKRGDLWASIKSDPSDVDWFPARAMSKCFSRITLEITNIKVERVQDITESDAIKEGFNISGWIPSYSDPDNLSGAETLTSRDNLRIGWDSLYIKKGFGWKINPWAWAISFRRIAYEESY